MARGALRPTPIHLSLDSSSLTRPPVVGQFFMARCEGVYLRRPLFPCHIEAKRTAVLLPIGHNLSPGCERASRMVGIVWKLSEPRWRTARIERQGDPLASAPETRWASALFGRSSSNPRREPGSTTRAVPPTGYDAYTPLLQLIGDRKAVQRNSSEAAVAWGKGKPLASPFWMAAHLYRRGSRRLRPAGDKGVDPHCSVDDHEGEEDPGESWRTRKEQVTKYTEGSQNRCTDVDLK